MRNLFSLLLLLIHLGGDEAAIEANRAQCYHCLRLMKQLGYTSKESLLELHPRL